MKIKQLSLLFALFCFGSAFAQDEGQTETSGRYANLEKDKSGFKETWVAPDADFTKFDKLYIWEAAFQYRDVGPARRTRSTMMNSRHREFGMSEGDREKFEEVISDAFVKEIQRARNFQLVEEVGPGTLIMRGAVLDIISLVPPELTGRSEVFLASIGEATLVMELIDSGTGNVLAVVAERRAMQRPGGTVDLSSMPTNNATIIADVKRWARRAANTLRTELDKAIAGK
jgi:hypothetical protein